LRNLRISSQEKTQKRSESYNSNINPYLKKDKLINERKSELLKSYGLNKRGNHASNDNLGLGF
jgi:hypothetical protein